MANLLKYMQIVCSSKNEQMKMVDYIHLDNATEWILPAKFTMSILDSPKQQPKKIIIYFTH